MNGREEGFAPTGICSSGPERIHMTSKEMEGGPAGPLVGQFAESVEPGFPFELRLPQGAVPPLQDLPGRYFLGRCSSEVGIERDSGWSIYLRQPLFVCSRQEREDGDFWQLCQGPGHFVRRPGATDESLGQVGIDPAAHWLSQRSRGDPLNLLGPLGNGFSVPSEPHNLLVAADVADDPAWFWQLYFLCEQALDRGGRATILLRAADERELAALIPWLPVQVEVRTAADDFEWLEQLRQTAAWADQMRAGVPASRYSEMKRVIEESRFRTDRNFAQVLVKADLACGVGACLVCVVPTGRGGLTRACVHGPVFDLMDLVD